MGVNKFQVIESVYVQKEADSRLDKDIYRMGESFDKLTAQFEAIARMTGQFKDLSA